MKDLVTHFIDSLPSSLINNSRRIVKELFNKASKEKHGGHYTRSFEEVSGIPSDREGCDAGNDPELIH